MGPEAEGDRDGGHSRQAAPASLGVGVLSA